MGGFTGFGGNSIGGDSKFGQMGKNDPYGNGQEPGGGSHGTGGGGNERGDSGASSPGQQQLSAINSDPAVRQRLASLIRAARNINPAAVLRAYSVNTDGVMSITVTGLTADQAKQIGLGGLIGEFKTVNGTIAVGDFETGHPLPAGNRLSDDKSSSFISSSKDRELGEMVTGSWSGGGPVNSGLVNRPIAEVLKYQTPEKGGLAEVVRTLPPVTSIPAYQTLRAAFDFLPVEQQPAARDQITQAWQRAYNEMPDKLHSVVDNWVKKQMPAVLKQVSDDISGALVQHQMNDATISDLDKAVIAADKALQDARSRQAGMAGSVPNAVDYYPGTGKLSRNMQKALQNMYEEAVRTGSIPGAARGQLRDNVQAMLNENRRLTDARAAAEAEVQRLTIALANARQAVVAEKKRQDDLVKSEGAERQRQAEEAERQRQAEEAAEKAKNEREALEKTSELIAGMGDKIGEHLGDKYKSIAKNIADDIKNFQGKTIRSFDDAMASMNKITSNPAMKINQADRDALVNAWKHVDAQDMANKLGNLSKAFKVADVVMKVEKVREKSIEGYETGNWGPLVLEVESWVLSGIASSVALGIFSAVLGSALLAAGVPAVVVGIMGIMTMVYIGSLIDDKFADALNNEIIRSAH